LKNTSAALGHLYDALAIPNPMCQVEISHLKSAIIKSGTTRAMSRSKTIPIQPFMNLFRSLPGNQDLDVELLRLKCISLLALCAMLRPSDIAPKAVIYQHDNSIQNVHLNVSDIVFVQDSMTITFHGIKNDAHRRGFIVTVPMATEGKLCPVLALRSYIDRTAVYRKGPEGPVFLTLQKPFRAITASTVSVILTQALKMAGLTGYLPKDFRPTGATAAVDAGFPDQSVMKVGRWKNQEVFREHYVHSKVPRDLTDKIISG